MYNLITLKNPTREDMVKFCFRLSSEVHSHLKKGDRIEMMIDGKKGHVSRYELKEILRDLLKSWNIEDPYLKFLHFDIPKDPEKFTLKEYRKHYQRDYRRKIRHISLTNWNVMPKKRGKKPTSIKT